jgi:uncharacterized protein (DUF952 family)
MASFATRRSIFKDGFTHFSTATQAANKTATHFASQDNLRLMSVDAARRSTAWKWEPSRRCDLFPHLYGRLDIAAVTTSICCRWIWTAGTLFCQKFQLWLRLERNDRSAIGLYLLQCNTTTTWVWFQL